MAKYVLKDVYCSIAGTNISSRLKSITVDLGKEELPGEAMGDNTRFFLSGSLSVQTVTLQFYQDFAASNVHALINAAVGVSTAIILKATSAATSATNPRLYGNMMCTSYPPFDGSMGDTAMTTVKFVPADGTGLAWSSSD